MNEEVPFEEVVERVTEVHDTLSELQLDLATWQDDAVAAGRFTLAHRLGHWHGVLAVLVRDIQEAAMSELATDLPPKKPKP